MQIVEHIQSIRKGGPYSGFTEEVRSESPSFHSLSLTRRLKLENTKLQTVQIGKNFTDVIAGSANGFVALWELTERDPSLKFLVRPDDSNISSVKRLSNNEYIITGNSSDFSTITVSQGRILQKKYKNHHVRCVTSCEPVDENVFITSSVDKTLRIVDKRMEYTNSETVELPLLKKSDLHSVSNQNYRKFEYFGGIDSFDPTADNSSLLMDIKDVPNGEIYQVQTIPGSMYKYLFGTGRSEAKIFDLRSPTTSYKDLIGFTAISKYFVHKPVTSISINDYSDLASLMIDQGSVHVFDIFDGSKIIDPYRAAGFDICSSNPSSFIKEDGKFDEESYLKRNRIYIPLYTNSINDILSNVQPKLNFSLHKQKSLGLHQTEFYGNCVISGSDTGAIIFYDTEKIEITKVLKPSKEPITCISTNLSSLGFAATAGDSVYLYEVRHPYDVDIKEEILSTKEKIEIEEKEKAKIQTPQNEEFLIYTMIHDLLEHEE